MPTIKTCSDHPASMAERVKKREQNSGGNRADVVVKDNNQAARYTNIHFAAGHVKPGTVKKAK